MEAEEKKCPQCAEMVKAEARICRFCGHSFEDATQSSANRSPSPAKGRSAVGKSCLVVLGIFVVLGIIGSLADPADRAEPTVDTLASADLASPRVEETEHEETENEVVAVGLTGAAANAARSAQQYLALTGFSREGLIAQLSSEAGNGYDIADATAAVDSLAVDWDEQAARSAEQYLQITGFSCDGLIEQLSSDAGSGYTESQARYGAERAGAC